MRALLDVNVLIALLDAEHLHHDAARAWLRSNIQQGQPPVLSSKRGQRTSRYKQNPHLRPSSTPCRRCSSRFVHAMPSTRPNSPTASAPGSGCRPNPGNSLVQGTARRTGLSCPARAWTSGAGDHNASARARGRPYEPRCNS